MGRRRTVQLERGQYRAGGVQSSQQQVAAHGDQACLRGVDAITARRQRACRFVERAWRGAEFAHGQRHFRLGHHAACARHGFTRTEAAAGAAQQVARAGIIAELRHGDAAQRQGGGIVAPAHVLECAEYVAGDQCPSGGGDQGVHARRLPRTRDGVACRGHDYFASSSLRMRA